jgi:hypothetical protein
MSAEAPPNLILFNIAPDTHEFLIVIGEWNSQVARGFAQPVVGLRRGWYPEYRLLHPFSGMTRGEFVISRVAPIATGTYDLDPKASAEAAASADFETNRYVLTSLCADPWIRSKCLFCNAGVFQMAAARLRSRDVFARQEYLKNFVELPQSGEHARIIADLCRPPQQPAISPVPASPQPTVKSQFEWDMLPDEDKARAILAYQNLWQEHPTPSASTPRSGIRIVIPPPASSDGEDWRPTSEEIESMKSLDWKKY